MTIKKEIYRLFNEYSEVSFDLENHENLTSGEHPEIITKRPNLVAPVLLPLIRYNGGQMRYGMHTDMIYELMSTLNQMHDRTKKKLYVQGRLPNKEQWKELEYNPVFRFFLRGRAFRSDIDYQKQVIKKFRNDEEEEKRYGLKMILPKGMVTAEEAREYSRMKFTPETKIKGLKIPTVWFQADFLIKLKQIGSINSMIPLFGGYNSFNIGSNDMPAGLIRKASLTLVKAFEDDITQQPLNSPLSDQALDQFDQFEL